ncbi:hypothetical protein [Neobacillus mesonae]|uniref:Uncharacterized protein n=1 Tax=Neobacillus mesonae TaxID=1193713 RepID=A0A3T0I5H2_9BACI|nr:hypothetical protein [Neobacillus mesonae]AZU64571.1 hypothetical protein CHR53_26925 [Neobacillus mesonae]
MDFDQEQHDGLSEENKVDISPDDRFEMGEWVKIKKIDHESQQNMEPEDYFYLKGFENKIGLIREQKKNRSGIFSYRVDFDDKNFGYFYGKDLVLMN